MLIKKKTLKKYLVINLTKEVKVVCAENYKTLMEETEDDSDMERYPMILERKK